MRPKSKKGGQKMPGILIDNDENQTILTDRELAAVNLTLAKIREEVAANESATAAKIAEMRAREEIKTEREEAAEKRQIEKTRQREESATAAKIAEMRAREEIKTEREARRAKAKAKERRAAAKARAKEEEDRRRRKDLENHDTIGDRARERNEREIAKIRERTEAREKREAHRQSKDRQRVINKVQKEFDRNPEFDYVKIALIEKYHSDAVKNPEQFANTKYAPEILPFVDWHPQSTLDKIFDDADVDDDDADLNARGLQVLDQGRKLAVACDHPAIKKILGSGYGYIWVLKSHPRICGFNDAIWFEAIDEPIRCAVFDLPINTDTDEDDPDPAYTSPNYDPDADPII